MEPQIKGVGVRGLLTAVNHLYGSDTYLLMINETHAELQRAVRNNAILPSGWYPLWYYRELHRATQVVTKGGPEIARAIGRQATHDDFRGVYRVLTFILSPQSLIRRAPGIFNRYYDTGRLEVPRAIHGSAHARFSGCAGFNRDLWEDTVGGCTGVLEVCGGRNVEIKLISGGQDNDDGCEFEAVWD
jgi:hypothetical protein